MTTFGLRDLLELSLYGDIIITVSEGLYSKITRHNEMLSLDVYLL